MMSKSSGFTLIEALLYLALFSIIIGGVLVAAYQIIQASSASQEKALIQEEGHFLVAKLNWALTGATNLAVLGPGSLRITKFGYPVPIIFSSSGDNFQIQKSAGPITLNSDAVKVQSLSFVYTPGTGGKPDEIQTSFDVASKLSGQKQNFSTIKYLRQ